MKTLISLLGIGLLLLAGGEAFAQQVSPVEARVTSFIKEFYGDQDEIQVKFVNNIPAVFKSKARIKGINFSKVPDAQGDGICIIEFESKDSREKNAYMPFKVFKKRRLFVLKESVKKGDSAASAEFLEKDTYLTGAAKYPASKEDIVGKRFKRDLPAGTVISPEVLEDHVLVQRGEVVNMLVENSRLVIHAKGKAVDKGRMGETIRVKNMTSGKEVFAKVTGNNRVTVEF
jgi:flagella basal body P-ring formation protein FlgA